MVNNGSVVVARFFTVSRKSVLRSSQIYHSVPARLQEWLKRFDDKSANFFCTQEKFDPFPKHFLGRKNHRKPWKGGWL